MLNLPESPLERSSRSSISLRMRMLSSSAVRSPRTWASVRLSPRFTVRFR